MTNTEGDTTRLQSLLDRGAKEDPSAYNTLLAAAADRLVRLTRKMLRAYPHLRRWEQTDDVFQVAALRLYRSLEKVQPDSVGVFWGLAATQIRRVLVDMCRKYSKAPPDVNAVLKESSFSAITLAKWTEFHEHAEKLEAPLKEIVDLLWYQDLTQKEAADILGVDESTVKRRWRKAREQLAEYVL